MSKKNIQTIRLTKIVDELKKGHFVNAESMKRVFDEAELVEGLDCRCSARTFYRDMEDLRSVFQAPIDYDPVRKVYFLTRKDWTFAAPVAAEKDLKVAVSRKVLRTVRDASNDHAMLRLVYRRPDNTESRSLFEPHVVVLHRGVWYMRGYKHGTNERRTYAVNRIVSAELSPAPFTPDERLIAETKANGPFDLPKIEGATLHVPASAAYFFRERAAAYNGKIEELPDGSLRYTLPPLTEAEILRFVMGGLGDVKLLEPKSLIKKLRACAQSILDTHA